MTNNDTATPTPHPGSENCLPIGTRLSDFEITGVLGEGGFGIVYVAYDHSLHRTVAIKEYMPGALALRGKDHGVTLRAERHQETFRLGLKSFINEARFLAQFDHPSLVKVFRFWEQNRTAYTAMQYYQGRTIKDIVAKDHGEVNEVWCRRVLRQILQALEMLYTMKILHRDVSPDNIIVQENGDAVLLDFGSARQIIGDMTKGLTVILKPGYAPVEQYAGDASLEQGPFTDIYALSAVMYYAITGEAPASSIARMIKDPVVPLVQRAPEGYGTPLLAALDKGMAVLAADRPQTIDEFRDLLGIVSLGPPPPVRPITTQRGAPELPSVPLPVMEEAPHPVIEEPPPFADAQAAWMDLPEAPPLPGKRRMLLVVLGAALLMGAGLGLYGLIKSTASDTIMLALPPASPALPRVAAIKPAPVAGLDPSESVVEAPPPLVKLKQDLNTTPAPAKKPAAATTTAAVAEAAPAAEPEVRTAAPTVETGTYKLQVKPWGTVFVDGRQRGVSPPLTRLTLPVGKHKIRIVNPSFSEFVLNVELGKGHSGTIAHDFTAEKK